MWALFFTLLAALAWWAPGAFIGAAVFTAVMAVVSIVFNSEIARGRQFAATAFPAGLMSAWFLASFAASSAVVVLIVIGVLGLVAMPASLRLTSTLRAFWMDAGAPIGWTVSVGLLALVYYLVITPIGLLRRLGGGDTLERRFEDVASYWTGRELKHDRRREYRQF